MVSLYNNHLNGILADEMGLGKTVQVRGVPGLRGWGSGGGAQGAELRGRAQGTELRWGLVPGFSLSHPSRNLLLDHITNIFISSRPRYR